jgi:PHD/YefM family antitoxin component YafN of YafNO toxin-antitoxin module
MNTVLHTISSGEFGHNVSSAKQLARQGPVFITNRGKPAVVLMSIDAFREFGGTQKSTSLL